MKKNYIGKCLILLILVLLISGCTNKEDKEIVLASNIKSTVSQAQDDIKKNINLGNKFLDAGKYDDAKSAYDRAIKLDKMNKNTYLTIEKEYMGKDRIQDAANIIQEAINNDVDTENMKKLFSQINAKIEAAKAVNEFNENKHNKKQPQNLNTNANNVSSQPKVVQNKRIIGYVQNIYEKNGKRYLTIDEIEFYRGDKAYQEAKKDGYGEESNMTADGYYIRDKDNSIIEYEISNSCGFSVDQVQLDPFTNKNAAENETVSYDKIKSIVNSNTNTSIARGDKGYNPGNLYWLTINNNIVVQVDSQYVP